MTLQRKMKDNALLSLKNNWGRALSILLFQAGVLVFFLLAIGVDAAGSKWYLWAVWIACAFIWIGVNRK